MWCSLTFTFLLLFVVVIVDIQRRIENVSSSSKIFLDRFVHVCDGNINMIGIRCCSCCFCCWRGAVVVVDVVVVAVAIHDSLDGDINSVLVIIVVGIRRCEYSILFRRRRCYGRSNVDVNAAIVNSIDDKNQHRTQRNEL